VYDGTNHDNGNVWGITDLLDSDHTQTFAYDKLNRLTSAAESGASGWGQSYTYDAWGNLWKEEITKGNPPQFLPGTADVHNRFSGYTYDAAGNMTGDGIRSYAYDGENRIVSVDGTAATYTYYPEPLTSNVSILLS
jgi:YD repeat-containing protein